MENKRLCSECEGRCTFTDHTTHVLRGNVPGRRARQDAIRLRPGCRNPRQAPTELCSLVWGNEEVLSTCSRAGQIIPEHLGKSEISASHWEMRTEKNGAEEESNLQLDQASGCPQREHKIPALSHETAMPAESRGCPEKARLLWGLQGSRPACSAQGWSLTSEGVNTFPSPPGMPSLHVSPGTLDAHLFLPLLIRSPTALYNAKITFLLPMQIMSEPSTLPCLMQKVAPQGRGGPGCSYKAY